MLKNTRKHEVLALRGRPEGHRSAKNTRKLEVFVVVLLKNTRKHEVLALRGSHKSTTNTRKYRYISLHIVDFLTS